MTPLKWITSDRVTVFLFITLGTASLYSGFASPNNDVYFGVDINIWLGTGFILAGILYWYSQRSEKGGAESE